MLIQGSAFDIPLADKSVHACVTSPPYWGLRKYSGEQGDEPLGLEATPERHIERSVLWVKEVERVLRDDGVFWLNYSDCYQDGRLMHISSWLIDAIEAETSFFLRNDLIWYKRNPMPESVAGWRWERQKIQTGREPANWDDLPKGWDVGEGSHDAVGKGNYRNDDGRERTVATYEYGDDYVLRKSSWRHTRAHEYVFQLVKGMGYYCNQEVVRERHMQSSIDRVTSSPRTGSGLSYGVDGERYARVNEVSLSAGRNPRSVLDVPTAPYKGSHYATFPPNLIAPLIRASVPRRCCPECGMAWAPVVEKKFIPQQDVSLEKGIKGANNQKPSAPENTWDGAPRGSNQTSVTAYRPTCEHYKHAHRTPEGGIANSTYIEHPELIPIPGRVLDIFGGSGTTGMVAKELMRKWVVMDISRPYLDEQAKVRTGTGTPSNAMEGLPLFEEASDE